MRYTEMWLFIGLNAEPNYWTLSVCAYLPQTLSLQFSHVKLNLEITLFLCYCFDVFIREFKSVIFLHDILKYALSPAQVHIQMFFISVCWKCTTFPFPPMVQMHTHTPSEMNSINKIYRLCSPVNDRQLTMLLTHSFIHSLIKWTPSATDLFTKDYVTLA